MNDNNEVVLLLKSISHKLSNMNNTLSKISNQYDAVNNERMKSMNDSDDEVDKAMTRCNARSLSELEERISKIEDELSDLQTRIESVNSKLNFTDRYNYQKDKNNKKDSDDSIYLNSILMDGKKALQTSLPEGPIVSDLKKRGIL